MNNTSQKRISRQGRHKRIRSKISGTAKRPRFTVFKSNKYLFVQLIDDEKRVTLISAKGPNKEIKTAKDLGLAIAKKAVEKKINSAVFDRGGYKYHGLIRELAEGAREGGLKL